MDRYFSKQKGGETKIRNNVFDKINSTPKIKQTGTVRNYILRKTAASFHES